MPRQENHQLKAELKHFTGSGEFYSSPLFSRFNFTEGVQYLAEQGECYWLLDYIFSNQILPKLKGEQFQVWKIQVSDDDKATFTVEDGSDNILTQLRIGFTDFPFNDFSLWMVHRTLMLPSEY